MEDLWIVASMYCAASNKPDDTHIARDAKNTAKIGPRIIAETFSDPLVIAAALGFT